MAVLEAPIDDKPRVVVRPKPGGGSRRFTLLPAADARAWHTLGGRVAGPIEAALSDRVVANRVSFTGGRWRLESLREALRRSDRVTNGWCGRALVTDVVSFYPSVRPAVAEAALLEVGCDHEDAACAKRLMELWAERGFPGLPVGPAASAVVANAVLHPLDVSLGARPFLRWVDDFRIAVCSEADASSVLERLDRKLRGLGLERSSPKTRIVEADEPWPGSVYR